MKKILAFLLAAMMLCTMFVLPSAAADDANYQVSIKHVTKAPVADGKININEYGSALPFHTYSTSKSQFSDDEHNVFNDWDFDFYVCWDKDNLYMAWEVRSPRHAPLPDAQFNEDGTPKEGTSLNDVDADGNSLAGEASGYIWMYSSVQCIITPVAPKEEGFDKSNYLEFGFGELEGGSTVKALWKVPNGKMIEDVAVNDWDAIAVRDDANNKTIYEIAVPWDLCGVAESGTGAKFGLSYAVSSQELYNNSTIKNTAAMIEWQDAILTSKLPRKVAIVTMEGGNVDRETHVKQPGTVPADANGKTQIVIDKVNTKITGEDCVIVTNPSASTDFSSNGVNLQWTYNMLLKPVSGQDGVYELIDAVQTYGNDPLFIENFTSDMIILGVHSAGGAEDAGAVRKTACELLLKGSKLKLWGVDLTKGETLYSNSMFYVIEAATAPVVPTPTPDTSDDPSETPSEDPSVDPSEDPSEDPSDDPSDDDSSAVEGGLTVNADGSVTGTITAVDGVAVNEDTDTVKVNGQMYLYPAGDADRVILSDDVNLRYSYILIFDAEGKLIELGNNLVKKSEGKEGFQNEITVPAGGHAVSFFYNDSNPANKALYDIYAEALAAYGESGEGAIYNKTEKAIDCPVTLTVGEDNTITVSKGEAETDDSSEPVEDSSNVVEDSSVADPSEDESKDESKADASVDSSDDKAEESSNTWIWIVVAVVVVAAVAAGVVIFLKKKKNA